MKRSGLVSCTPGWKGIPVRGVVWLSCCAAWKACLHLQTTACLATLAAGLRRCKWTLDLLLALGYRYSSITLAISYTSRV